ncbi:hypothetical protein [Streptomyces sp. NPDC059639]|uniref:hypothetical protein n=1 Tax=Streptomyces sp. NPDC059639 TaxID=3346891 RepID=UPI00367CBB05
MVSEVDVVVADVSGSAAELAFGLGMRHALGRCTIHVADEPARTSSLGTHALHLTFPVQPDAIAAVREALASLLAGQGLDAGSLSGRPDRPIPQPGTVAVIESGDTGDDVPGLFDLVVEAEAQLDFLAGDMRDVESALADLAEMMQLLTEDMDRVNRVDASMAARMTVLHRLAKAMEGPTDELESAVEGFVERMGVTIRALRAFLDWAGGTPRSEWPEGADQLLDDVAAAPWRGEIEAASIQEVMEVINFVGTTSRQLRRPTRRVIAAFQAIFRSVSVLDDLQAMAVTIKKS